MGPNNPPCWTKHRFDEMFYSLKCVQNPTTILLRRDATSSVSSPRWEMPSWVCFARLISAGHVRQASQPSLRASLTVSFRRGGSALSASWTSELVILSARMSPDTLQRKTARACDLIVGVERLSHVDGVQSFLPDVFTHDGSSSSMGITTGSSCAPATTTTPKAFTQYRQQAAKLLNTPFVGHFKCLESCITRTTVHKENII